MVQLLVTFPSQSTNSATPAPTAAILIPSSSAFWFSRFANSRMSSSSASPPRWGLVGLTVRCRISPVGHNTMPAAVFVPPMSRPIAPIRCLFLVIVHQRDACDRADGDALVFPQGEDREDRNATVLRWRGSPLQPCSLPQ